MLYAFQFFMVLTLVLYTGTFANYLTFFLTGGAKSEKLARPLLWATMSVHLLSLVSLAILRGHIPVTNRGEAITTAVLGLVAIYYYLEHRTGEKNLGPFVIALALVLQGVSAMYIQQLHPASPVLERRGFIFHALTTILAYSGFFLAFVASALYLMLRRQIKRRNTGYFFRRLPSLGMLDTMSFHAILVGLIMFTVGLFAGAMWSKEIWGAYFKLEPKFILSGIVWLTYLGFLLARTIPGWSAKNGARLSCFAFTLLALLLLVSAKFSPSHHF